MMNVDRKETSGPKGNGPSSKPIRILAVGGEHSQRVDLQAALAALESAAVETIPTLAQLSRALQEGARPDLLLVDVNADNPEDIQLLRDLRKTLGREIPIIALTESTTVDAPIRAMRAGVDDVLLKPINLEEAREAFNRVTEQPRSHRPAANAVGKVIAFMHLSGGAGATTLAVNSGCALARSSGKTRSCLLDLDLQFGNASTLLDLPSTSSVQEFLGDPRRLDAAMLDSMMLQHQTGLQVLTAPDALLPLTALGAEEIGNLIEIARSQCGYVVLDLPLALAPWTDSVLKSASVIYLVTGMNVPSVHRHIKLLEFLREEGLGDLPFRVVANRYHTGTKRGNDVTVAQFEQATGQKVDFKIPNDYSLISLSHGQGKPAVRLQPNSAFTLALTNMLGDDLGKDIFAPPKPGLMSRVHAWGIGGAIAGRARSAEDETEALVELRSTAGDST